MYVDAGRAAASLAGKLQAIAGLLTAGCVRFAGDSPLEEAGFELLVPRKTRPASLPCLGSRSRRLFWYRQATWCELADFFFD
jgi:hypothetical protein